MIGPGARTIADDPGRGVHRPVDTADRQVGSISARGRRPLTLAAQQSFLPARAAELAGQYADSPRVRRGHRVASIVWGAGLLTEAVVRVVLVYLLPIDVLVGVSSGLTVVTFGGLIAWNARYVASHARTVPVLAV